MSKYAAILQPYIDSTMMSAFRACPRKFYHEFILGLRPQQTNIHLHAGGCLAVAMEHFYHGVFNLQLSTPEALKHAFIAFDKSWGDYPKEITDTKSAKTYDRMWEAVMDYVRTYPPHTDHVQPYRADDGKVTTEFSFAIPLDAPEFPRHPISGDPFIYAGRFDMLGRLHGTIPCVRDEKTTSYAGATWADQWNLRAQFMGYVWACQMCNIPLETVVVRGIVIRKTGIDQVEAIKTFPSHMIDRWYQQLARDLHRLVECWNSGYFDYNFGESCTAYGNCMFTSVCQSNNPEAWMSEYAIRRWNPLLRVATSDETDPVNLPQPTEGKLSK